MGDRNVCRDHYGGGNYECAGANQFGQLGDGTTIERHGFVPVTATSNLGVAESVFTAGNTSCAAALSPADASKFGVYCWGSNQFGSVGDGTTTDRSSAAFTLPGGYLGGTSGGGGHGCAFTGSSGSYWLWCWGNNADDSLGLGPGAGPIAPAPVQITIPNGGPSGNRWAVAPGVHHTCAIAVDGTLWCWGLNDHGQLGDGTTVSRSAPTQVAGLASVGAVFVSPSGGFTCATIGELAYCWGRNDRGQLGDGTTTERHVPGLVLGLGGEIWGLAPGEDHACIYLRDTMSTGGLTDRIKCWGANDHGQVGDGTTTDRTTPVLLTFSTAATAVPDLGGTPTLVLVMVLAFSGVVGLRGRRRAR